MLRSTEYKRGTGNMGKKFRWFILILMILAIGGCGVQPEPGSGSTQQETAAGETGESDESDESDESNETGQTNEGQIILRVATGDSGAGLTPHQDIIDRFEAENPDITVELESVEGQDYYGRLLTQIAANDAPDIMQIGDDALPKFAADEALLPLDPFLNGSEALNRNMYLAGLTEPGQWQGQQYLLPKDYSPLAVFYNKNLFDEAGLSYPEAGWTWTDFLETAQTLTQDTDGDGQTDVWGVQLPASWTSGFEYWVAAAGGQLISEDGRQLVGFFDAPETVEAVQFYADLYNEHQVAPLPVDLNSFGGGNSEFENGQAAMWIFGRWPQAGLLDNPDIDLGVVGLPQHKTEANLLFWGGFGLASGSQHPEAAWRFLSFYAGEPGAQVWKEWGLPVVEAVAEESGLMADPIESVWLEQLDHVVPRAYTYSPYWEQTGEPALRRVLETVIIDPDADVSITLQRAAREAQSELEGME